MNSAINIVHLSDLHISPSNQDNRVPLESLADKLREIRENESATFDLLVITGDLVDKGATDYTPVTCLLKRLCQAAGLSESRLFAVPGNHDVVRGECKDSYDFVVDGLKQDPGRLNNLLNRTGKCFQPGFAPYTRFIRQYPLHAAFTYPLPGFSRADLTLADVPVRLCGLNSALIAGPRDAGDDAANMNRIAGRRFLFESLIPDSRTLNLVLSHYPLSWFHKAERQEILERLQMCGAIVLTGHIHTPTAQRFGVAAQSLELGVGSALGQKWNGNQHCRLLTLDADIERVLIRDLLWSPEYGGWRTVEPVEVELNRWIEACPPAKDRGGARPQSILTKCSQAGLTDIRSSRNEGERTDHYSQILESVSPGTELIIVGRSLKDWLNLGSKMAEVVNQKGVKMKLGLLDPNSIISRPGDGVHPGHEEIHSWIEKPIPKDWAITHVPGSMQRIRRLELDAKSTGSIEVYGLPFYVSHSFVAYTNKRDGRRYCAEEAGMALEPLSRPFLELSATAKTSGSGKGTTYGEALEWMYRAMLTKERLILSITPSTRPTDHDTTKRGKVIALKCEALGLVDLAVDRENLEWKKGGLNKMLEEIPEAGEIFMVGRSLVAWTQHMRFKSLTEAIRTKRLKCTLVIADPTLWALESLVEGDYAQGDLRKSWRASYEDFCNNATADLPISSDESQGFLEVYGIPAFVPVTFARYTDKEGVGYCVLEPGIGVTPNHRPVLCFRQVDPNGNDIYGKLRNIYDGIPKGQKLLFSNKRAMPVPAIKEIADGRWMRGNASRDGLLDGGRGWFIGSFLRADRKLCCASGVEVKWGHLSENECRPQGPEASSLWTLTLLVAGRFAVDFPGVADQVILEERGDYVLYAPGVSHDWKALKESVVVTLRWPSQ